MPPISRVLGVAILVGLVGLTPAFAQFAQTTKAPTAAFAAQSLRALSAVEGDAGDKWRTLAAKQPTTILKAIASAERRGWKPTARTLHAARGKQRTAGPRSISQTHFSTGDGEFLVWDWDDGDSTTAEGTVWAKSFATNAEVMFNVQIAGDSYENSYTTAYEVLEVTVDGATAYSGAVFEGDANSAPASFIRAAFTCTQQGYAKAVFDCQVRAGRERVRDGMRGAAVGAGVAGVWGAFAGGLAGAIAGAGVGAAQGFIGGVIGSFIWGSDYDCYGDTVWQQCEENDRRTRGGLVQ